MRAFRERCASGRVRTATLVAAAVATVAIGCGGGDDQPSPATGAESKAAAAELTKRPLTKAELIAKADSICVADRRALRRLTAKHYKDTRFPNPAERLPFVSYSEDVLRLAKKTVRQLKALTPPPGLRSAYEKYVAAHEEIEDLAEQALDGAIEDNDGVYYKARKTRDAGILERAELAEVVGLKKCSPNPFFR